METKFMIERQVLFTEDVALTGVQDYGYSWIDFTSGKPVPTEGARFDIYFEGDVKGEQINGKITGVDYLEVRPDRHLILNLQARILTDDGVSIKVMETGINSQGNLRLNMTFQTADERYSWLNKAQVWGMGEVSFETGAVKITGYII